MDIIGFRARYGAITWGAWIIIGGQFLVGLGNVGPLLSVFLQGNLQFGVVEVSTLLSVRLWTQRGGAFFAGLVADRFGSRRTMVTGLLVRSASSVILAFSDSFGGVLVSVALLGAGSALYTPSSKKALLGVVGLADPVLLLSLRNASRNLGFAIGPTVCLLAAASSFRLALLMAAVTSLAFAAAASRWTPEASAGTTASWSPFVAVSDCMNRRVLLLFATLVFFFALYTQLEFSVSLFAEQRFSRTGVALLWAFNALGVILLQVWLTRWMARTAVHAVVMAGLGTFGLAFFTFALPLGVPGLLGGVLLFTIGEIVVEPKVDEEVARLLPARSLGTGFGLLGLGLSVGGTLGFFAGGWALQHIAQRWGYEALWAGFAALAICGALLLGMLMKSMLHTVAPELHLAVAGSPGVSE